MKRAIELRMLADKFNKNNKYVTIILNCCENWAKKGYYKTSFNNFGIDSEEGFLETWNYLESLGYKITEFNNRSYDKVDFIVSWNKQ